MPADNPHPNRDRPAGLRGVTPRHAPTDAPLIGHRLSDHAGHDAGDDIGYECALPWLHPDLPDMGATGQPWAARAAL